MTATADGTLWAKAQACRFVPSSREEFVAATQTFEIGADADLEEFCLAFACHQQDRVALAAFEDEHLRHGEVALRTFGSQADTISECLQRLRSDLLVQRKGEHYIRLLRYAGLGRINSLVRVSCIRYARYLAKYVDKGSSVASAQVDIDDVPGTTELWGQNEPEANLIALDLKHQFKSCFQNALLGLGEEDRTLLRLYYVQEMTMETLAKLFKVDKSSVSRRITRARARLLAGLTENAGATELMQASELFDGQLDLSMSRLLRSQAG
tara:strand:+ start:62644 stop:63444 length:801 start_codon:yes stop_codon:yes gene_type:complete